MPPLIPLYNAPMTYELRKQRRRSRQDATGGGGDGPRPLPPPPRARKMPAHMVVRLVSLALIAMAAAWLLMP